jgi:hypothetical protein
LMRRRSRSLGPQRTRIVVHSREVTATRAYLTIMEATVLRSAEQQSRITPRSFAKVDASLPLRF